MKFSNDTHKLLRYGSNAEVPVGDILTDGQGNQWIFDKIVPGDPDATLTTPMIIARDARGRTHYPRKSYPSVYSVRIVARSLNTR